MVSWFQLHSGANADHGGGHRTATVPAVTQVIPRFPCSRCNFSASTVDGLAVHTVQMHREEWICSECGADFDTKTQWQEHCRTYHSSHHPQVPDAVAHENSGAMGGEGNLSTPVHVTLPASSSSAIVKPNNDAGDSDGSAAGSPPLYDPENGLLSSIPKYTRNYACPHRCGFGTRQSRDFLHHLRDHHGERFAIFYCGRCSYASKFLAKVKRHQMLIHERIVPSTSRYGSGVGGDNVQMSPGAISLQLLANAAVDSRDGTEAQVPCVADSAVPGSRRIDYSGDGDEDDDAVMEEGGEEDAYERRLLIDENPQQQKQQKLVGDEERVDDELKDEVVEAVTAFDDESFSSVAASARLGGGRSKEGGSVGEAVVSGGHSGPVPEDSEVFKCSLCPYSTNEWGRFRKHARCHQTTSDTKCHFCSFSTVYSWNLDRHVRCHRTPGRYTCRRCSFSQNTRQSMSFHLQHHHTIETAHAETQTDDSVTHFSELLISEDKDNVDGEETEPEADWTEAQRDLDRMVSVGAEPFIFEKHVVRLNEDIAVGSGGGPGSECSRSSDAAAGDADYSTCSETEDPSLLLCSYSSEGGEMPNVEDGGNGSSLRHADKAAGENDSSLTTAAVDTSSTSGTPSSRQYLSEHEAIETPTEVINTEYEFDPDIKSRYCSICGYHGKWISEMIRHKRVHTNERPFRCRYCSRTSKWKADLIRHVAKVHGIRVVSKYSRSKTFDGPEAAGSAPHSHHREPREPKDKERSVTSYKNDNMSADELMMSSEDAHGGLTSVLVDRGDGLGKKPLTVHQEEAILEDVAAIKTSEKMRVKMEMNPVMIKNEDGSFSLTNNSTDDRASPRVDSHLLFGSSKDLRDLIGSKLSGALEKYVTVCQGNDGESLLKCRICPYETKDLHTFRAHTQKHENKKPYQCSTCGYRSNWSSDVHKHIRLKKSGHESAYVIKLNEAGFPHIKSTIISPRNRTPHLLTVNSEGRLVKSNKAATGGQPRSAPQVRPLVPTPCRKGPGRGKLNGQLAWKCLRCDFENDNRSDVIDHLNLVHNSPPYACRHCNFSSQYRKPCILHTQSQHNSLNSNIVENMICEYRRNAPSVTSSSTMPMDSGAIGGGKTEAQAGAEVNTVVSVGDGGRGANGHAPPNVVVSANNQELQPFKRRAPTDHHQPQFDGDMVSYGTQPATKICRVEPDYCRLISDSSPFFGGKVGYERVTSSCQRGGSESVSAGSQASDDKMDTTEPLCCDLCPFQCCSTRELSVHMRGHEKPKCIMSYKCVFCDWYSKKKLNIFHHLKLHTSDPFPFMAEVERNLITPLSQKAAADEHTDSNALFGVSGMVKKYACSQCCFATDFARNMELHRACHGSAVGHYRRGIDENFCTRSSITSHSCYGDGSTRSRLFSVLASASILPSLSVSPDAGSSSCRSSGSVPLSRDSGVYVDYKEVGELMSDFTAILDAADQEISKNGGLAPITEVQTNEAAGTYAVSLKTPAYDRRINGKLNATSNQTINGDAAHMFSGIHVASAGKEMDPNIDLESYIHAGEHSLNVPEITETVPRDIQKICVVVNGEVKKMWQCRYCPHASKRRANIRMHEKKHFKANALGLMKCPKCNYRGERRSLNIHYRVHSAGGLPISDCVTCLNCPAMFRRQDYLNLHMLYHTGKFDFSCSLCKYSVPSEELLRKHMRVHEGGKVDVVDSGTSSQQLPPGEEFASGSGSGSPATADGATVQATMPLIGDDETAESVISSLETVTSSDEEESNGGRSPDTVVSQSAVVEEEMDDCLPTDLMKSRVSSEGADGPNRDQDDGDCNQMEQDQDQDEPCDLSISPSRSQVACHEPMTVDLYHERRSFSAVHHHQKTFACSLCDYSVPYSSDLLKHLCTIHCIDEQQAAALVAKAVEEQPLYVEKDDDCLANDAELTEGQRAALATATTEEQPLEQDRNLVSPSIVQNGGLKIKINLGKLVSPNHNSNGGRGNSNIAEPGASE